MNLNQKLTYAEVLLAPPSTPLCRRYLTGFCRFGNGCRFRHMRPAAAPSSLASATPTTDFHENNVNAVAGDVQLMSQSLVEENMPIDALHRPVVAKQNRNANVNREMTSSNVDRCLNSNTICNNLVNSGSGSIRTKSKQTLKKTLPNSPLRVHNRSVNRENEAPGNNGQQPKQLQKPRNVGNHIKSVTQTNTSTKPYRTSIVSERCSIPHQVYLDRISNDYQPPERKRWVNKTPTPANWVNAPVFVPQNKPQQNVGAQLTTVSEPVTSRSNTASNQLMPKTWSNILRGGLTIAQNSPFSRAPGSINQVCPFESPCPFNKHCAYRIHLKYCDSCLKFCLHPNDLEQQRQHRLQCLQQHEENMEHSFAMQRSENKMCSICFDIVIEKTGREKRFGILPNCFHIFCLECIRKWRKSTQFHVSFTRGCPECRIHSDFVCPSKYWIETKEQKDKLLNEYRTTLSAIDCKYFRKGAGDCHMGNKCFYRHALPNGELIELGNPGRPHPRRRIGLRAYMMFMENDNFDDSSNESLWEYEIDETDDFSGDDT